MQYFSIAQPYSHPSPNQNSQNGKFKYALANIFFPANMLLFKWNKIYGRRIGADF